MNLSITHKRVIDFLVNTNKPIFLTGKAGTGKTTFLHYIKNNITKNMAVVAPTAIAALNAGGVTINSFFQIPFGPLIPNTSGEIYNAEKVSRMSPDKAKLLASLQLLIIDEISMVRADTIDRIDSILKIVKGSSRPFGGVQLLMIGDLYQLPPVYQNDWPVLKAFYTSPYFFNGLIFNTFPVLSFELTEVFRQSDPTFVQILNSIRNADINASLLGILNKQYNPDLAPDTLSDYITLSTHNSSVSKINESRLENLKGELLIYKATVAGDFPKEAYPAEPELRIKTGAQIIFIKNDSSGKKQYYNGRAAKIIAASENSIQVRFLDDGSEFEVVPETWENVKYALNESDGKIAESNNGSFTQYPIKLAWAITIHKSQGLTFDKAVIDVEAAFASGQSYVALSRCRTLEGLVLKAPVKAENIITDGRIITFMQETTSKHDKQEILKTAKLEHEYEVVADLFNFSSIQQEWRLLSSMIDYSDYSDKMILLTLFKEVEEILGNQIKKVADKFLQKEFSALIVEKPLKMQMGFLVRLKQAAVYFKPKIEDLINCIQKLLTFPLEKNLDPDFFSIYNQLMSHLKGKLRGLQVDLTTSDLNELLTAITEAGISYHPVYQLKTERPAQIKEIVNPLLLQEILTWRVDTGTKRGIADYLVLSDQLCVSIAAKSPRSLSELAQIKGVGAGKATELGDDFVKIIRNYLGENDLFA
ncbi:HRDC domain-containing protein [Olivibacter domesticus]|uniref:HRDC domain-containing protein n=1 Tax=Olivibacter domesticus TaxID=407022 RepID=A0A1H7W2D7_OLID1|nr:HRDC domain-containing protein [Olivibacter domesticus]SEM15641.1 HRDC domain-containing protein [Olivibacter domesticus]